ncbi:hypothetical protein [Winogradskyella luteola]|uniref:Uncharacterized protein n=1 Tax=Winogradskyella luteola TaxID=2828330 RepID=A0A9X1F936_9FLAO|nr:hypothetical protein [Winogradskyella luteola]MBV7269629.1 hypothetical protein [Winogradskyella luteola]
MKTLKITLALVAIAMLTVSGVQSDKVVNNEPTYKESSTHINLLAHKKNKLKAPTNG